MNRAERRRAATVERKQAQHERTGFDERRYCMWSRRLADYTRVWHLLLMDGLTSNGGRSKYTPHIGAKERGRYA
jgi:hypothetical protein